MIVRDLASGPRRFVELQRVLPGISTEQLRSRLNRMVADGMLTRKRYREVPPRVDYELTERARELMPILGELARWGYEWAWSPPRQSEAVDLGAIFRLAPGLLGGSATAATVELRSWTRRAELLHVCALRPWSRLVRSSQADGAAARVSASTADWIRAFSPERDRGGLEVTGDHKLAGTLLDGLALAAAAARAPAAARPAERRPEPSTTCSSRSPARCAGSVLAGRARQQRRHPARLLGAGGCESRCPRSSRRRPRRCSCSPTRDSRPW